MEAGSRPFHFLDIRRARRHGVNPIVILLAPGGHIALPAMTQNENVRDGFALQGVDELRAHLPIGIVGSFVALRIERDVEILEFALRGDFNGHGGFLFPVVWVDSSLGFRPKLLYRRVIQLQLYDLDSMSASKDSPLLDMEITLHRVDQNYQVELRFNRSDSEADVAPILGEAEINLESLKALTDQREDYGKLLYEGLFSDPKVHKGFVDGCYVADGSEMAVRVRLYIAPDASELHSLCWEALRDPQSGELLGVRERFLFSRFISNDDFRPVRFRAEDEFRALVVIANPSNIGDFTPGGRPLPPLDVAGETARATKSLGSVPMTIISGPGTATFNGIVSKLREGHDILYLICHGALMGDEPRLCLEDEAGQADMVLGTDLVTRLSELKQRPRLVVLASCQSAGTGDDATTTDKGILAALGPRLAQAGIPAVIAMQGNVTMRTIETFMPIFFGELQRDGQIDRAMAVARGAVRKWEDWWMPVLFMSLKQGRIRWYKPGFTGTEPDFERWKALVNNIRKGTCTPIIGSGMLESLVGSFRDIARDWATTHSYPMAGNEREQLPLVAQYLVVNQEPSYARDQYCEALKAGALRNYGHDLTPEELKGSVQEVISAAGAVRRRNEATEPHKILAGLNLPVYLTTNPDNLLSDAILAETKNKPHVLLCPRGDDAEDPSKEDQEYRATKEEPLVYHLFGHLSKPDSVVLTQDDYFDYLIDVKRSNAIGPKIVGASLTNTSLLFLGFQMSDWDFRVFFRGIMSQGGRGRLKRYAHVAVQIDPEQERSVDPARARKYLETYFSETKINIFWGSAEDFLSRLQRHMQEP